MAENMLTGGVASPNYPAYTPYQAPANPLTQASQALQMASQMQTLQQQQFQIGKARLDYLHDQMGSIAALPNPTFKDVTNVASNLQRMGYPSDQIATELANAPQDSAGIKAWATQHMAGIADHAQRWQMGYGAQGTANLGDVQQPIVRDIRTGVVSPAGPGMSIGMSPSEKASSDESIDPATGARRLIPRSSRFDRTGYALPTPGMPAQGASPAASMAPQGMSGAPTSAQPAPSPAGTLPTSLPAGQNRFIDTSTDRFASDLDSARNVQGDLNPLQQARSNLMALGKNGIGPGTEDRNKIASFLQSAGLGWLPGVDSGRIENMDEALKYTTQAMQGRAAAMRAGTDQQQATTAAGSPNLKMSSAAALNVLNSMIGLRRMQQAQTFENSHDAPGYLVNSAKWAANQDPRAYSFDLMSDDQKQKTLASLGSKDSPAYQRFMNSLRSAHGTGLLNQ